MGGPSAEAEVSRVSAAEVARALEQAGHRASLLELDAQAAAALTSLKPDVVFPALHGPPGEDGTVQGFLEILDLPYVGSGVHGSAVAMDKSLAKAIFRRAGLPVADDLIVSAGDDLAIAGRNIRRALGDRVVIKPLCQGSAIGVTRVPNGGDLTAALQTALAFGRGVLVEPYIDGREITVGVLDVTDDAPEPFPVIEILTASDEWYDYTNRYTAGKSEHVVPADVPEAVADSLREHAVRAHVELGLRDLSRADYIVTDADEIVLLEVNTLPGMTPTSLYPDGARAAGRDFPTLVDLLVQSAHRRAAGGT